MSTTSRNIADQHLGMDALLGYLKDEIQVMDQTWKSVDAEAAQAQGTTSDNTGRWSSTNSHLSTSACSPAHFIITNSDPNDIPTSVYSRRFNANPPSGVGSSIVNGGDSTCSWYSTDIEPPKKKTIADLYSRAFEPRGTIADNTGGIRYWQKDAAIAEWVCGVPQKSERMSLAEHVQLLLRRSVSLDTEMAGMDEDEMKDTVSKSSESELRRPRDISSPAKSMGYQSESNDDGGEYLATLQYTKSEADLHLLEYQALVSKPWEQMSHSNPTIENNVDAHDSVRVVDFGQPDALRFVLPKKHLARLKGKNQTWPQNLTADTPLQRKDSTARQMLRKVSVGLGIRGKRKCETTMPKQPLQKSNTFSGTPNRRFSFEPEPEELEHSLPVIPPDSEKAPEQDAKGMRRRSSTFIKAQRDHAMDCLSRGLSLTRQKANRCSRDGPGGDGVNSSRYASAMDGRASGEGMNLRFLSWHYGPSSSMAYRVSVETPNTAKDSGEGGSEGRGSEMIDFLAS